MARVTAVKFGVSVTLGGMNYTSLRENSGERPGAIIKMDVDADYRVVTILHTDHKDKTGIQLIKKVPTNNVAELDEAKEELAPVTKAKAQKAA